MVQRNQHALYAMAGMAMPMDSLVLPSVVRSAWLGKMNKPVLTVQYPNLDLANRYFDKTLHPHHSLITSMELFQNVLLQTILNDHTNSQNQTITFYCHLIFLSSSATPATVVRSRPSKAIHCEQRIEPWTHTWISSTVVQTDSTSSTNTLSWKHFPCRMNLWLW